MFLLRVAEEAGGFVKDLRGEAVVVEVVGEQRGKAAIVFNDGYRGFLLGVHADRWVGGKTVG